MEVRLSTKNKNFYLAGVTIQKGKGIKMEISKDIPQMKKVANTNNLIIKKTAKGHLNHQWIKNSLPTIS